jgi:hypothetical protein
MNYIQLINNFWDEVPHTQGYKSQYGILYFAIVNCVNRNSWRPTRIDYDRLMNSAGISKPLFLEGRKWLSESKLIKFQEGKNAYTMAVYEVNILTATSTATSTATDTATIPSTLPNSKHINYINNKQVNEGDAPTPKPKQNTLPQPAQGDIVDYMIEYSTINKKPFTKSFLETESAKMFNYYESNGWIVGKSPMKNWKAAARNWLINSQNSNKFAATSSAAERPTQTNRTIYT